MAGNPLCLGGVALTLLLVGCPPIASLPVDAGAPVEVTRPVDAGPGVAPLPPLLQLRAAGASRLTVLDLSSSPSWPCPCSEQEVPRGALLLGPDCACLAAFEALKAHVSTGFQARVVAVLTPDPSGGFRVLGPPGLYALWFEGEGREADVEPTPLPMPMSPSRVEHRVQVVDAKGQPLAVELLGVVHAPGWVAAAQRGEGGVFPDGFPLGSATVWARTPQGEVRTIEGQELVKQNGRWIWTPPTALQVRVVQGGRPAAGATVRLRAGVSRAATTDARGVALFTQAAFEQAQVLAFLGTQVGSAAVTRSGAATQKIQVTLGPSLQLQGRITEAGTGAPLAGVRVSVNDRASNPSTTSDADGGYRLDWVVVHPEEQPLSEMLRVEPLDGLHLEDSQFFSAQSPGATTINPVLERSVGFSGRVVDSRGQPVADAHLEVFIPEPAAAPGKPAWHRGHRRPATEVETDEAGRFTVPSLRPVLRVEIALSHRDHPSRSQEVELTGREITLSLDDKALLEVELRGPGGERVTLGCVEIDHNGCFPLEADGILRLGWHPPGKVKLWPNAADYSGPEVETELAVGQTRHVILSVTSQPRLAAVRGQVLDARGRPSAGVPVELLGPTPPALGAEEEVLRSVKSGPDGRFVFEGVEAEHWRVRTHRGRHPDPPQPADRQGEVVLHLGSR